MSNPVKESWRNVTKGKRHVLRYDPRGNLLTEIVKPGGTVQLTQEERELNMDKAASEKLCIFRNGSLSPVRLLDEDLKAEFASNPNNLGDSDIPALFKAHWKVFDEKISQIDNIYALERLRDFAEAEDSNVTVRQHSTIMARIDEVSDQVIAESDHRIVNTAAAKEAKPWQTM